MMEVIKEAQHKSYNLKLCSLTTATVAVMEQMEQKLDKLSTVGELSRRCDFFELQQVGDGQHYVFSPQNSSGFPSFQVCKM